MTFETEMATPRVVSVRHFPEGTGSPFSAGDGDLIEVHANGPVEVPEVTVQLIHVTMVFENETVLESHSAIVPFEWFVELIPLRTFLNIPEDARDIDGTEVRFVENDVDTNGSVTRLIRRIREVAEQWRSGHAPRTETDGLLTEISDSSIAIPGEIRDGLETILGTTRELNHLERFHLVVCLDVLAALLDRVGGS